MTPPRNPTSPGAGRRKRTPSPGAAPTLGLVRGGASSASFPQRAGASSRQLVLFNLMRSRAKVLAALQGLTSASSRRLTPGEPSVRDIVVQLYLGDCAAVRRLESHHQFSRGESWKPSRSAHNAATDAMSWDEVRRLLDTERQLVIEALERIPELPPEAWSHGHPLADQLNEQSRHEVEQADLIKRLRGADVPENPS